MNANALTANESDVMWLLTDPCFGYLSPTKIAQMLHPDTGRHSAWASPICKRLVAQGLATRREDGWYATAITRADLIALEA